MTPEEIAEGHNVYLVDDIPDGLNEDRLLKNNFADIFEKELNGCIIDRFPHHNFCRGMDSAQMHYVASLCVGERMRQMDIHAAQANISCLVEQAANGKSFGIMQSGKPLVTVSAYAPSLDPALRHGFLKGRVTVPENFVPWVRRATGPI